MRHRRTQTDFLRLFRLLFLFVCALLPSPEARASDLEIVPRETPYVGRELILSLQGEAIAQDPLIEWSLSGDVKPVLLRNGGLECAFTPSNASTVDITVLARSHDGQNIASADLELTPRYADAVIEQLKDQPLMLWDIQAKEETPTSELSSSRPIGFGVKLVPPYNGELRYVWTSDASTSILSEDNTPETAIARSEIGDAELSVKVFNAAGILMGAASLTVPITIPSSRLEDSARQKAGWADWEEAQTLWSQRRYAEGMELAQHAASAVPEDPDITSGLEGMAARYARVLRSIELQEKGFAQREKDQLPEALRSYRQARVLWPMPEIDAAIKELEEAVDALRVRNQQAEWLRDTASAYDQEGMFQEALDYYAQSQALVPLQPIEDRMARISRRLTLIAEADRLAGEGNALERNGKIAEAIESYKASLEHNPDGALSQHVTELEAIVERRKKQAAALLREGIELQRQKKDAEALTRYRESEALWPSSDAQKRMAALGKSVPNASGAPLRAPEDFGIGTKADAARFLVSGNKLYGEKRYREALEQYRKSYAISQDQILSALIRKLEVSLKEYEAVHAANALIKEANLLYNQGLVKEAVAKYRESLAVHANTEVEAFLGYIENTKPASLDASPDERKK